MEERDPDGYVYWDGGPVDAPPNVPPEWQPTVEGDEPDWVEGPAGGVSTLQRVMSKAFTLARLTDTQYPYWLAQPVLDVVDDLKKYNGRNMGTIGDVSHLWNNGSPRTIANRRHGDHTPWSADGPPQIVKAIDIGSLAGTATTGPVLLPPILFRAFVVPCVMAGLYAEYKYGISDWELRDARPPWNMKKQAGGDGPDHLHLSFMPNAVKSHCKIIAEAVKWNLAGRPPAVEFVKSLRGMPMPGQGDLRKYPTWESWYKPWGDEIQMMINDWRYRAKQRDAAISTLQADVTALKSALSTAQDNIIELQGAVQELQAPPDVPAPSTGGVQ